MYYYKASIQYDGTNYAGMQWQNDVHTVQGALNDALSKLLKGKVTTTSASRTDTGVHAFRQIIKISSEQEIRLESFLADFNGLLPKDILCLDTDISTWDFSPSVGAKTKEYRYFFTNSKCVSFEDRRFIANISNPLDMEKIYQCVSLLTGTHDFCNFCSSGSNVKSTTRSIFYSELEEVSPSDIFSGSSLFVFPNELKRCYQLRIKGDGFLKQMIRHLVRGLWMVGSGRLSVEEFSHLLDGPKVQKQLWKVASPNGLFLYDIQYK